MAAVGGIFFCALLIGMGCLIWYKRGQKIEAAAKKMAIAAASETEAMETKARGMVNTVEQAVGKS
jgi:hypothetical protein